MGSGRCRCLEGDEGATRRAMGCAAGSGRSGLLVLLETVLSVFCSILH